MKIYLLVLAFLTGITVGHTQNGVIENFDDNTLSPNWVSNLNVGCPSCYVLTETNYELRVANNGVGPNYENFEYRFPTPLNLSANPIVKISIKNSTGFSLRLDLTDVNGNATNQTPNVKSISVNGSFTEFIYDFTGKFNQITPTAATVDATQIAKVVFMVNPGGSSFASTFYFNNLIVGLPPAPIANFTANATSVCIGNPVIFTNTSTNATSYSWSFVPGTSTVFGPHTITWSSAGTKTVALTATGPDGSNNTFSMPITVTGIPSAAGAITGAASACSETSGVYSIAAVSGATSYNWSLPAGATITSGLNTNNVTILFGTSGGTISVTPVSNCGSGAASSLPVAINPSSPASVSISTTTPSICSGASVTFTATPTNGGASPVYQWKVDGTNVGTNSPTFTTSTLTDNDVVTVVMTSNAPCASGSPATSNQIVMNVGNSTSPTVTITSVGPLSICAGSTITLAAHPVNVDGDTVLVWKKNGIVISGESNDTLVLSLVNDNDAFMCEMTYNGCASGTVNSNTLTFDVSPRVLANVFVSTPNDSVCLNSLVTFTATPVNGGATPSYQWKVNNINQGTNSAVFSTSTLADKDTVTVVMTSNSTQTCLINNPATAMIGMRVFSTMTSSVVISASSTTTCSGNPITFTATPTKNGGTSPSYQWKVGNVNQGTNSPTFTYNPANNDIVTVVMTPGISCAQPSTSNSIQVTVTSSVTPSVIVTTPSLTVCAGSQVTFTANPTHGGTSPTYSWKINGIDQAAVLSTFTTTVSNGNQVTVEMTSNLSCAATTTATSAPVVMTVNPVVTPSVSIGADFTSICKGSPVTFTATPTHGGSNPSYLWKLNGSSTEVTTATYTTEDLYNGDVVTCEMISNKACASTTSAVTSNSQTITVTAVSPVSIVIDAGVPLVCSGTAVTFTASATNGGSTPVYQWKLNNNPVGTNSSTYNHAGLSPNDEVICLLTSNKTCATGSPATSNTIKVTPAITPTIVIDPSQNPVCSGSGIIFTSQVTGEGTSPSYKWKKNGGYIPGEISSTYNATTVNSGDIILCELTSNASCAPVTPLASNAVTVSIIAPPGVTVNIAPSSSNSICSGEEVTFTATPSNPSGTNSFQWFVNGQLNGDNDPTFTADNIANNQIVHCVMTTSTACGPTPTNSNSITMTVSDAPSAAQPGLDKYITSSSFFMEAEAPGTGIGTWTTTGAASIQNINSPNTLVQNLSMGANTFTWTVTSGNCQSSSEDVTIHVGVAPTQQAITGPLNVPEGATSITYSVPNNGSAFIWSVTGGANITSPINSTSVTIDFLTTDATVSVTEITQFGNYTSTILVDVGEPNSIFSSKASMAYSLFPNPFIDEATLVFHSPSTLPLTIIMVNMNGEKVFESSTFKTNENIILGKDIPAGLYAVLAVSEKGTQVIKLHKE